jgi:aminoglycoside 6'-N-acetyltransferase
MSKPYSIRRLIEADLPLVTAWRAKPHVIRWWGEPSLEPELEKLADPRIALWLAMLGERPIAFIQDYAVHASPDHHFAYLPDGSRGMDIYIGEEDLLGRGHGARLVRQHVDERFAAGTPAMGIDPHPNNLAAQRAFTKAGFHLRSGPVQTRWSYALLMDRFAKPPPGAGDL